MDNSILSVREKKIDWPATDGYREWILALGNSAIAGNMTGNGSVLGKLYCDSRQFIF